MKPILLLLAISLSACSHTVYQVEYLPTDNDKYKVIQEDIEHLQSTIRQEEQIQRAQQIQESDQRLFDQQKANQAQYEEEHKAKTYQGYSSNFIN